MNEITIDAPDFIEPLRNAAPVMWAQGMQQFDTVMSRHKMSNLLITPSPSPIQYGCT